MGKRVLEQIVELWQRVSSHGWRLVYLVSVLAFFLPFASIKGCNEKEYKTYSGFELMGENTSLILPLSTALFFFVLSFLRRRRSPSFQGFLLSGKACLAWLAVFVLWIGLLFGYLFSSFVFKIGLYLSIACWALVFVASLYAASAGFFKIRSLRVIPRAAYSKHISVLLVVNYLLSGSLVLVVFLIIVMDFSSDYPSVVWGLLVLVWTTYAVSFFLLFFFLNEGIKRAEKWAGKWSMVIAAVLLLGWAAWSYSQVQGEGDRWVLWMLILFSLNAAVALVKSVQFSLAMASHQRRQGTRAAAGHEGS